MKDMQDIKPINRLKVVLVEQNCTGKWLAEAIGKNEATVSRWCSNIIQPSLYSGLNLNFKLISYNCYLTLIFLKEIKLIIY